MDLTNFTSYVLGAFLKGIISIGLISGLFYLTFWQWGNYRFRARQFKPNVRIRAKQYRFEITNMVITILSYSVFEYLLNKLAEQGKVVAYFHIAEYGWLYWGLTIILLFIIHDTWFYWTHRLLHIPFFYRTIHRVHHTSRDTNPFSAFSMHPIEAILLNFWIIPVAIWLPVHFITFAVFQLVSLLLNIIGHLGYEVYPKGFVRGKLRWKTTATHHQLHHASSRANYGLYFTWWDRWFKTESPDYQTRFDNITR